MNQVNCVINPLATIIRAKNGLLSKKIPQSIFEEICLEIVSQEMNDFLQVTK